MKEAACEMKQHVIILFDTPEAACEMKEAAAEAASIAAAKWHRKKQRLMVQVRGSMAIEMAQQVRKTNKSSAVAW